MKLVYTIFLSVVTALLITAAVFLTIDGNLAKLTGWYRVTPGMPLFTDEHTQQFPKVGWMRISDLHDRIECEKDNNGTWWIVTPFKDKLDPKVVNYLLGFAANAAIIDTLEMDEESRRNMRDFGFASDFCDVTLKVPDDNGYTTAARFKLGKEAPWLASVGDGKHVVPTTYLQTDFYGDDDRVHVVSGNISALFNKGLNNLRDPMPLRFDPNKVASITIAKTDNTHLELTRKDDKSPWMLKTQNNTTLAEQENVAKLLVMLCSMEATRVQDKADVPKLDTPQISITVSDTENQQSTLYLYGSTGATCYATVSGRDVVFTLRAASKLKRKGGFASIVNAVYSMPVLPAEVMAEQRGLNEIYTDDLPVTLDDLRSKKLATFDERDVECVLIRSRNSRWPLRLTLTPGIKESNTQDSWTVEAEGKQLIEAETDIVRNFLKSFRSIPVEQIVEDLPTATDEESKQKRVALIRKHGLYTPDYRVFITPRTCAFRTSVFGVDLPLIKDRKVKIFSFALNQDPETGEITRLAMEENGNTIYRVSHKLTRNFSLMQNTWRARNLLSFHISELKKFTLDYQQSPLVLEYESVAESWSGTLGGVDITSNINPHRAHNCVDRLRKIKVREWLDPFDADALAKLETPVFRLIVDLEKVDHSEVEAIITDAEELGHGNLDENGNYRQDAAAAVLDDDSALADKFRDLAFNERPVIEQLYTIEIAPVNNYDDKPMFYGRIRETGQLFIINFEDAQSLGSSPLDGNVQLMQTEQ